MVTEPNSAHQFYAYIQNAGSLVTNSMPSNALPVAPVGGYGFDSGNVSDPGGKLNVRNSFQWDQRQFLALSTAVTNALLPSFFGHLDMAAALNSLTWSDFLKGRLQHWLLDLDGQTITECVSSRQEPSFDSAGQFPGSRTWFDYGGKLSGFPFEAGTELLAGCVAQRLPDGSSQFIGLDYGGTAFPVSRWENYTTTNGTVGLRTNSFVYATNGVDPLIIQRPAGQATGFGYNAAHQVIRVTNAVSDITGLTWDPYTFNLTEVDLPGGESITLSYYPTNVPGSAPTNNGALLHTVGFSQEGRIVEVFAYTNGLPYIVHATGTGLPDLWLTNTWDGLNRLRKTTFTDQTTVSNYYVKLDLAGQKDRLGHWTYYGYDPLRHLTSITNALSNVTSLTWCDCGALTSITDPLTNATTFNYNNQGLLTSVIFPDLSSVSYYYDSSSRLTNAADGATRSVIAGYNNQGLLTNLSTAYGTVLQVLYDTLDRPVHVTGANNVTVTNGFDLLNRLLTRAWPSGGGTEQLVWNIRGLASYTDRDQKVTLFSRDTAGRLIGVTNANQEVTAFAYNALNQLTDLDDGRTNHTTWHFNQYGWLTNKIDALTHEVFRYTYDPNGQITNRWTPQAANTTYVYDPVGNLTNISYIGSSTPSVSYTFDALNRLKTMTDALGTHTYAYTEVGQLQTEIGTWTSEGVTNGYAQQLRQSLDLARPSGGAWSQAYGYDMAWRLNSLASPAGSFAYGYNIGQSGSPSSLVRTLALPNGASETNHYDALGRMDFTGLLDHWGHVLEGSGYIHDPLGLRTNITRYLGMTTNSVAVGYDNIGQIISWKGAESNGVARLNEQLGWGYDKSGNLQFRTNGALRQTFASDAVNQLTNVSRTGNLTVSGAIAAPATNLTVNGLTAQTYGDLTFAATNIPVSTGLNTFTNVARNSYGTNATNIVSVSLPNPANLQFDLNGNMTSDGTRSFVYDAENRLVTNYVTGAWKSEFVYDGLGRRRIERDYGWNGNWNPTNELHFIYDGWLLVQVRDALNTVLVTYTRGLDLSGSIAGAGGIGGLLARTDRNGSMFYHADGAGNVTALMDSSQLVKARYLYNPFGRVTAQWGPMAGTNEMQFASMPRHANSGLSLFTFRGYDPSFQRWIQRDPLEELADINLYRGMLNSPLDVLDPNGLLPGAENAPVAFPASMALPQTPVSTPLPTIGPMTQAIIPYPGPAQLPNPFTYDALLIGANHLVDTPIGYELAKGNALNYLTAPGTQMAVGGLLGKLSPLLKNLKPCPAASFPTKAAAREALKQMGLPEGQLAKALSAVTKATSGSTIGVSQNGEDLIVSITRPGFNGYQEMQYTISPEGLKTVVQRAFDSAGNIVHYDPKNP